MLPIIAHGLFLDAGKIVIPVMKINLRNALIPRDIGLILTYRCLPACAHCLYNCGKGWHDWMLVEDVQVALEQAKKVWGRGFQVHLTGGEPFMNFPLLLESTRIAVSLGIPVYVETNAGWCRDKAEAAVRFRQLREAGMDAVLISVSPFHQETIPLQCTLDGISAARAVFGDNRVIVYQSQWLPEMSRHDRMAPVPLDTYVAEYGQHQAGLHLWQGFGLISGGRSGYSLGDFAIKRPAAVFEGLECSQELLFAQHSHMDLYGNFIPAFCGGIALGQWYDLAALVKHHREADFSPMIELLIEGGPYSLYQYAHETYDYRDLEGGYAGKCHLCVDVRRHLIGAGVFVENLHPAGFYDSFEIGRD